MSKEAANPVPWRRGTAAHPCTCPRTLQAAGGTRASTGHERTSPRPSGCHAPACPRPPALRCCCELRSTQLELHLPIALQTHPKLIDVAQATVFVSWSTSESHQRGWVPWERLEQSAEQTFPPASKRDLYRLPPPSFQEERSQSSIYSQRTGEKNEIKEVSSLSTTPNPPKRGLRNWLCSH